jgi:hypothetical protein
MLKPLLVVATLASLANPSQAQQTCHGVIPATYASDFAGEWIAAWNSHDLPRILSHYSANFEMRSPGIVSRMKEPSGILRGADKVGAYWRVALDAQPDLKFELLTVFSGIDTITIHYRNQTGRQGAETLEFGDGCKVVRSGATYAAP